MEEPIATNNNIGQIGYAQTVLGDNPYLTTGTYIPENVPNSQVGQATFTRKSTDPKDVHFEIHTCDCTRKEQDKYLNEMFKL